MGSAPSSFSLFSITLKNRPDPRGRGLQIEFNYTQRRLEQVLVKEDKVPNKFDFAEEKSKKKEFLAWT